MNALDQYLVSKCETTTAFAARIGCDKSTVSRIRRGKVQPTLRVAQKIISGTKGQLTIKDLLPLPGGLTSRRKVRAQPRS